MTVFMIVVAATLLISGLCSLFEATLYSTRIPTLEASVHVPARRRAAKRFLLMKEDVSGPTSAILILNTVANTAGASLAGMYAAQVFGAVWVPLFSIGLTFAILFISEILPKTYGATHWREVWAVVVWPLSFIEKALKPLVKLTQRFAWLFTSPSAVPVITQEEIRAMLHVGAKEGQVSERELRMIEGVFGSSRILCRQIMVPRGEVVFLDVEWPLDECIAVAKQTQHTRYPLCRGSMEDVLGIVHVKDLLGWSGDAKVDLTKFMRAARHVPETMRISSLLTEMQQSRQHMAIVVDEHGSTAGVVTLENVIEEIVGTVQDEFDREAPQLVPREEHYIALGSATVEGINRELGLHLRAPGINTLSGIIAAKLGRFPEVGDRVELDGVVARVLETENNRALKIRLDVTPAEGAPHS